MIKFDNTVVSGWEAAIRGMRNPMNSWDKSDSTWHPTENTFDEDDTPVTIASGFRVGPNDLDLMKRLAKAGSTDAKYRRMINVTADVTAPLYWWKEYDTYKVGTVANSCSTMHKIHSKEFAIDDFSHEHVMTIEDYDGDETDIPCTNYATASASFSPMGVLNITIDMLNLCREKFIEAKDKGFHASAKLYWWQMIQLLPSSYNQRRTIQLNYEVLAAIYPKRKDHKLDEWRSFCNWIESLPYSELITLKEE
jgi:hypothetical protein